jgi:hypothetical protein
VQVDRRSWQQRNRIKTAQGVLWLTVPMHSSGKRDQLIEAVEIDGSRGFPEKHLRTLELSYRRARHYARYADAFGAVLGGGHKRLAELNIALVSWFKQALGIDTELARSSLMDADGHKTERLVALCRAAGAERYLSPPGSRAYLDEGLFARQGIEVAYHAYRHPEYVQLYGDFVPYLSVVDLLFNEGDNGLTIIRSGRGSAPSFASDGGAL